MLTTRFHIVPRLRMNGAVPLFPFGRSWQTGFNFTTSLKNGPTDTKDLVLMTQTQKKTGRASFWDFHGCPKLSRNLRKWHYSNIFFKKGAHKSEKYVTLHNADLRYSQQLYWGFKALKSFKPNYLECVWNLMAHGDAREGKWRGNWRMEWVASTLTLPRNVVYPALLPLMRTTWLPAVDWTDAPAGLNGLVRFGERRNLVSARVPSHLKLSLPGCTA